MDDEGRQFLAGVSWEGAEIRFCERFDGQSRIWNFERHAHEVFEFLYFLDGGARIRAGDEDLQAGLFDLVVYPPGVVHEERLLEGFRHEIICFWVDLGTTPRYGSGLRVNDGSGQIRALVETIYAEVVARRAFAADVIRTSLQTLWWLVRRGLESPPADEGLVGRCLGYIQEHYTEDFGVDDLARAVAVSPSYLFRVFKKTMGVTPMHVRNQVRVEKAKLLLCQSNRRVELVALEVGFGEVKHFSQLFKRATGVTPGVFRAQNRPAGFILPP